MSLAMLSGPAPSLVELVDGLAARTGAWVLVERLGTVIAHGAGTAVCPQPVVVSVVCKSTAQLRASLIWERGGGPQLRGRVEDVPVTAVELGDGVTAWFIGAAPEDAVLPLLSAAAKGEDGPITDPYVEELLHPRGPRRRHAPSAVLVALRHEGTPAWLSRRAASVVAGSAARVHAEGDLVLVTLPADGDVEALHDLLGAACSGVVSGVAVVPEAANDWVATARLASTLARIAASLGLPVGHPSDPLVAAELVVTEAHAAVADLLRALPGSPLGRLQEHDDRTSGKLLSSLRAWCRAAFDVPAAAASLHVHPNTLRYRLKRASEVCGLDIGQPRHRLALQLLLE